MPKEIPWHQDVIVEAPNFNGHWEINVAEAGNYRITLMERPAEAHHAIAAKSAELEVGGKPLKQSISAGAEQIHFDVELDAGRTQLRSTLTNEAGATRRSLLRQRPDDREGRLLRFPRWL